MIIFGGSSSEGLAREVSKILGCELGSATLKRFPDGEGYVRIERPVDDNEVIVIQSTSPPQDENLIELFLMLDALNDMNANVSVVIPYYGYGRQDRAFQLGEAVASRTVAKHIALSAKKFFTINPHKTHILDYFDIPALSLDSSTLIGDYFSKRKLNTPVVVAPDKGSKELAQNVANVIGCECENCEKKRLGPGEVVTSADMIDLDGNDVVIVDDIIDSGGTIVEVANALLKNGAGGITVACVHPVLTRNASNRILKIADELVATNSIQTDFSKISVAPLIAKALMKE
jgi:ribose-phosphate pyrophosphokinase